ncbi:MAG: hypothetical protein QW343_02050 [Candidatus Norongarragalinales archaeon]
MSWLPLSGLNEDSAVIFFFVLVALMAFTGMVEVSENPLVWGFAVLFGVVFAIKAALLGAGLGVLLPLFLLVVLLYFQGLGKLVGDGVLAWIFCAFVIMVLAGAGLA